MAQYIINTDGASFTIKKDNITRRFSVNSLLSSVSADNVNVLFIYYNDRVLYSINVSSDNVDVNGTTTFADAAELDTALSSFFFFS